LHQAPSIPICLRESGPTRNTRLEVWYRKTTTPLYDVLGIPSWKIRKSKNNLGLLFLWKCWTKSVSNKDHTSTFDTTQKEKRPYHWIIQILLYGCKCASTSIGVCAWERERERERERESEREISSTFLLFSNVNLNHNYRCLIEHNIITG
jgi:hypothetical protein